MKTELAPIVIFAFNRPDNFKHCIESLLKNPESNESELIVFIDGPRITENSDVMKVKEVGNIAYAISGFRKTTVRISQRNKGLGSSIIKGITEVMARHDAVIVLEDDLIVQPNFLKFMNDGLQKYRDDEDVWSICGYSNKIKKIGDYKFDAYFAPRSSSWGWATWKDRWMSVDWTFNNWETWKNLKNDFNKWGGSDCFGMLRACRDGLNQSWAIRFCFNQFLQGKLSLFPLKSLVDNRGFDGEGTNCKKYSRFKFELMADNRNFYFPDSIKTDTELIKQALFYHSIPIRLWSRLMYIIKG